ncbi:MAG TPA: 2-C-methyl-D-erythritol 2,4-cyclodiphosphate synthase [Acidimicrobiales bacterium]|nr:2-C-methyl-D-erythritol 2,4-cyclodiphosphate synthase [Acidimicrobiales bacterium]
MSSRSGIGIDVHPFSEDPSRALVLGGVRFEGEPGLEGHSDADVVAHAVCDALLGAAGLGDIGMHFPDSDDRWRGADSLALLSEVAGRVRAAGYRFVNADCTVVAERPRILAAREDMITKLSQAAGGPVHVKATRPERLGALGRVEGIACLAVASLEEVG